MRVLVTGGLGFIGSHIVDRLVRKNHEVVVVDDLSGGSLDNRNKKCKSLYLEDCRSASKIDKIFKYERPEVVFHLAANAAENKAQFSPIDVTSRNYDAFIKVLTPFIKYGGKRFIFTSSIAVYGAVQTPFKETTEPKPEDLYGINKLAIEKTLKVMCKVHNFEYVIVRLHNVFGPRQNMKDPYRNVVTLFMNSLLKGQPYNIYGDGGQKRQFSYIDDVADAVVRCVNANVAGMVFNVGSETPWSVNELSRLIQKISGIRIEPRYLPARPQEVKYAMADNKLAKKYLKFVERVKFQKGLRITWEWAKRQGPQKLKRTKIEIESEKLPENWK